MKAAFLFLTPDDLAQANNFKSIETHSMMLTTIGVKTYHDAVEVAQSLVEQGYTTIELCGGFGYKGVSMIQSILPKNVALGVVRFDIHPQLQMQSGDAFF